MGDELKITNGSYILSGLAWTLNIDRTSKSKSIKYHPYYTKFYLGSEPTEFDGEWSSETSVGLELFLGNLHPTSDINGTMGAAHNHPYTLVFSDDWWLKTERNSGTTSVLY